MLLLRRGGGGRARDGPPGGQNLSLTGLFVLDWLILTGLDDLDRLILTGLEDLDWRIFTVEQVIVWESMGGVVTLGMARREDIIYH